MSRGKRLSDSNIEVVLALSSAGKSIGEISDLLDMNYSTVSKIVRYKTVEGYKEYRRQDYEKYCKQREVEPEVFYNMTFVTTEKIAQQIARAISHRIGHNVHIYEHTETYTSEDE